MSDWATAVAKYVAAVAALRDPLTDEQIRAVQDALVRLTTAHYALLAAGAERAVREERATIRVPGRLGSLP